MLTLAAGQSVTLAAKGGPSLTETCCTVDVALEVRRGESVLANDDDGAGQFDSQLTFTADVAGDYLVRVTTSGSGPKRGPYTLRAALVAP